MAIFKYLVEQFPLVLEDEFSFLHNTPDTATIRFLRLLTIMADISIGQYIFTRLSQLGVKSVFGVPGGSILRPKDTLHQLY